MTTDRRLIIMRHAKSSWKSAARTDHDRPLNDRGRRDAPRMARALIERSWLPQLILSSDSRRTRETYEQMRVELQDDVAVVFCPALYHGGPPELCAELRQLSADVTSVLALGHNPGWEDVVTRLTGEHVVLKTASVVLLEGSGNTWDDALRKGERWIIKETLRPREL